MKQRVALFIHGFGSSSKCWAPMLELLRADERIAEQYDLETWTDYPTKWLELNVLNRIPRVEEIGRSLLNDLQAPRFRGREITLVGHSQGGLVIQACFAKALADANASLLRNVRQAIFFATPCLGSKTAMSLRLLMASFASNSQEVTLRVFNPEITDIRSAVRERIVGATCDDDRTWRIPVHVFCGMQDNIVPEATARADFESVFPVRGNHFTILRPEDRGDERYAQLAQLLLEPGGHAHRFEVEEFENVLKVEPVPLSEISSGGRRPRTVVYDNYATLDRRIRFAASNRRREPYTISYTTRNDGLLLGTTSQENEASSSELTVADTTRAYYRFDFTPEADKVFRLLLQIYRGFDEGQRNVHFHLADHSWYQRVIYEVDLSPYLAAGWTITREPELYFDPSHYKHGARCDGRALTNPVPVTSQPRSGAFRWMLQNVREGTVDIVWDVGQP